MKRLGRADMGVSTWLESRLMACGFVLMGGAGRAKGFGGPWAPAERRVPALGDGGGKTTPWCCWPPPAPPAVVVPGCEELMSSCAEAVPASSPDCSLGICTFKRGRLASDWFVFALVGARMLDIAGTLSVR